MKLSSPTTDLVAKIALKWWEKRPFSEEGKARRKARREQRRAERKARREGVELTSELIEVEVTEGSGMLQGKLTYTGIAATALGVLLGWVGLGDCTAEMMAEYGPEACQQASAVATALVDKVVVALGLVVAVIGRIRAARREKALRGE